MCVCASCTDFQFPFQEGSDTVDSDDEDVQQCIGKNGVCLAFINFLAAIGFGVGKLYPADYLCKTQTCKKVVHNSAMSLCLFVFDVSDLVIAFYIKKEGTKPLPCGLDQSCPPLKKFRTFANSWGKVINYISGLAYLIFDAVKEEKPGAGSRTMVALACTAEVIVMLLDMYLWCIKNQNTTEENGTNEQELRGISVDVGHTAPEASSMPPLTAEKAQWVVGNDYQVRIRSEPSTSASEIGCKSPGSVVTSEGTVETGDGHKWIKLDGKPHYMMVYNADLGEHVMRKN